MRKHLRQGYYLVFRILNVDTQAIASRARFLNRAMCDPQRHCQGASLRSKQLTFVAAIALTFDMGICFRRLSLSLLGALNNLLLLVQPGYGNTETS